MSKKEQTKKDGKLPPVEYKISFDPPPSLAEQMARSVQESFQASQLAYQAQNLNVTIPAIRTAWNEVIGQEDAKEALRAALEYPDTHSALYEAYGKKAAKGCLLYGPPGCGKTMLGRALASTTSRPFRYIKTADLLDSLWGGTERKIKDLFQTAPPKAIVYLDEAESILGDRTEWGGSKLTVPPFLAELDGINPSKIFLILATNRPEVMDPAVLRDGRIDRRIKIERPTETETSRMLSNLLAHHPCQGDPVALAGEINKDLWRLDLARRHMSGALVDGVVKRAVDLALERDRKAGQSYPSGISSTDLLDAVASKVYELRDVPVWKENTERRAGFGNITPDRMLPKPVQNGDREEHYR